VAIWQQLRAFDLSDREDEIAWKFSSTGSYSSKFAYKMQYAGTFPDFEWAEIWNTMVENKCKFFSWLILQNRLWTADRILRCGGQPNTICSLCHTFPESAAHMVVTCSYSRGIWVELATWLGANLLSLPHGGYRRFKMWWRIMLMAGNPDRQERLQHLQRMIAKICHIWKERYRQVYDNKAKPGTMIAGAIQDEVRQWSVAWHQAPGSTHPVLPLDIPIVPT
jgi:hypothetical protein